MTHLKRYNLLLIITLTFCSIAFGQARDTTTNDKKNIYDVPQQKGNVNDYEHLFSNEQTKYLNSLITNFENRTTIKIAIVTIDTTMISKDNFDDFILQIINNWGAGQKEKNNGVLIAISSGYRKIRIQNGSGIDKVLSNVQTLELIEKFFVPGFEQGEMYNGTLKGLLELMEKLK